MAIVRTLPIDDTGSGKDGTVFDRAWWLNKYNEIDNAIAQAIYLTLPASGVVARLNLGADPCAKYIPAFTGAADLTVQTISAGRRGDSIMFINGGTGAVLLPHAMAAECLQNVITAIPTIVGSGGHATYEYLGPFWHLVDHMQGAQRVYTPIWAASTTNPAGGVISGRYIQQANRITAEVNISFDGGTYGGVGQYTISLPAPLVQLTPPPLGTGRLYGVNAKYYNVVAAPWNDTSVIMTLNDTAALVGASNPAIWGASAQIALTYPYIAK